MLCAALRGIGFDIIILEEAAYINPDTVYRVVVPLLLVENTALLCISTIDNDPDNYYNSFTEIPSEDDENEKMFFIIRHTTACEKCLASGNGGNCNHKVHQLPSWKPRKRQRKAQRFMANMPSLLLQEVVGAQVDSGRNLFPATDVTLFIKSPHFRWIMSPDVVYVGIDPSGGGSQSDYAIVSTTFMDGRHVIIGMDHTSSFSPDDVEFMIYAHLMELRRHPVFGRSLMVVFVEANMSNIEVSRVVDIAHRHPINAVVPCLGPHRTVAPGKKIRLPGVITTHTSKAAYVHTLRCALVDNLLCYGEKFVCALKPNAVHEVRETLESQMRTFKINYKMPADPAFQAPKFSMSGKTTVSKDDLLMSLMFCMYYRTVVKGMPEIIMTHVTCRAISLS